MSFIDQDTTAHLAEPLLKQSSQKTEKTSPKLLNKRKSDSSIFHDVAEPKKVSVNFQNKLPFHIKDVTEQLMNSFDEIPNDLTLRNDKKLKVSQKKSVKVQFNKKRGQEKEKIKKQRLFQKNQKKNNFSISQSISEKFELEGLRLKSNWQIPARSKVKSFNSQIMNMNPQIQKFLYYMNLVLNTVFRLALLVILALMIVYHRQFKLMQLVISLQIVATFLYSLAMIKMLYTKKDEESIYFQKNFTNRDITDIEMDRILRKHFTWRNILKNVSAYFRLNSKFKKDIKISLLRQEIFKRIQIVLCFIPFMVIFFTAPSIFKFECDYPVELIATSAMCLEFFRIAVHYIVIFIQN